METKSGSVLFPLELGVYRAAILHITYRQSAGRMSRTKNFIPHSVRKDHPISLRRLTI